MVLIKTKRLKNHSTEADKLLTLIIQSQFLIDRYIIFIGLILFYGQLQAQQYLIDQFVEAREAATEPKDLIDYDLGLARSHMFERRSDVSLFHAKRALQLAKDHSLLAAQANAMGFIMMAEEIEGTDHYTRSKETLEMAHRSNDANAIAFASYLHIEFAQYNAEDGKKLLEDLLSRRGDEISIKNKGNVLKVLAWQYERLGDLVEAERTYLDAVRLFEKLKDTTIIDPDLGRESTLIADEGRSNIMQCHGYLSEVYLKMGLYEEALKSCDRANAYAVELSTSEVAFVEGHRGDIYAAAGELQKAIESYTITAEIHDSLGDYITRSIYIQSIGDVFMQARDFSQAEKYYLLGYELIKDLPFQVAPVQLSLGTLYEEFGDYDKALLAYQKADSIHLFFDDSIRQLESQIRIASVQLNQGLSEVAFQKIASRIDKIQQLNDPLLLHSALSKLSEIRLVQNNVSGALNYATEALQVAKDRTFDKNLISESHKHLSTLYKVSKEYETAIEHLEAHHLYNDSIQTDKALAALKREQVKQNISSFQEEKLAAENQATLLGQRNKLYILLASLLGFLVVASAIFLRLLARSRNKVAQQNEQLQALNKTKDRFFSIIAHDIRSPIVALESVEQQMQFYAKKDNPKKLVQLSGMVTNTARNLNALLDNLLNWARQQTGEIPYHPQDINAHKIVEANIALFAPLASSKDIALENILPNDLQLFADSDALHTICRNLISNAIKFSLAGGKITVSAKQHAGMTELIFSDTGVGMDKKVQQSLFHIDSIKSLGTKGEKGTGLGLLLCKDLMERAGGSIRVESKEGKGTSFYCRFNN